MLIYNRSYIAKLLLLILLLVFSLNLKLSKNINKYFKNKKEKFPSKLIEKQLNLSLEFVKTYSVLFEAAKKGLTQGPQYSLKNIEPKYQILNKGVGICSIGRKENLYVKEFVEYYLNLGIKKIIIYDDNEIGGENFSDVLVEYVINNKVEIIDIHGFESAQFPSYNHCYKEYGSQFDFLLFLDFDEFVKIENNIDINTYLYNEKFNKCETIALNWIMYGDNNLLKYNNRTMNQRFIKAFKLWNKGKSIVRTNISDLIISSTLLIGINTHYFCDSNGIRLFPKTFNEFKPPNKPEAYIKHFYTKTVEEFCNKISNLNIILIKKHDLFIIIGLKG